MSRPLRRVSRRDHHGVLVQPVAGLAHGEASVCWCRRCLVKAMAARPEGLCRKKGAEGAFSCLLLAVPAHMDIVFIEMAGQQEGGKITSNSS